VGRVTRDLRTVANSAGHATANSDADIDAAGTALTAEGDFVPVVMPANMNVTTMDPDRKVKVVLGKSPIPGDCSPRTGDGLHSAVIDFVQEGTGRTLAHEVGHYLGAEHPSGSPGNNLMAQTGTVANPSVAVEISHADKATMLGHCTIRQGLPVVAVSDFAVFDPAHFTFEELMSAARGGTTSLKPQLAVTLLKAKLGDAAIPQLADLARDAGVEPRARHAATLALASFSSARQILVSLSTSPDRIVADAAAQALNNRTRKRTNQTRAPTQGRRRCTRVAPLAVGVAKLVSPTLLTHSLTVPTVAMGSGRDRTR
jgi:hypothetical protein